MPSSLSGRAADCYKIKKIMQKSAPFGFLGSIPSEGVFFYYQLVKLLMKKVFIGLLSFSFT